MNDQENLDSNPSYDLYNSQEQIEVEFFNENDIFLQTFENNNSSGSQDSINPDALKNRAISY